jgi:hypothetical protein
MINIFIGSFIICSVCFIFIGVGVLFLGKTAKHEACGRVPDLEDQNECASQKAGLCPFEDKTGALKIQRKTRLTYPKI